MMHFQVRTDNHIKNSEALAEQIRAEVDATLTPRYADQLRRVEVYLQDTNSHKSGIDKRCAVEVHLAGYQAVTVDDTANTIDEAVSGALDKMLRRPRQGHRPHERPRRQHLDVGPGDLSPDGRAANRV